MYMVDRHIFQSIRLPHPMKAIIVVVLIFVKHVQLIR
ncbi:hypothetical protein BLA29_013658 [Euroglyphus maynei]|uniref:Uncharacterized protein n=1 Tax=Euroglyphus maynei TaxID=6958 RepID=A0A1Y3BD90_EURMA|nr:hypothetical protein BLA29_013658 [Euroglyphus maynei]